MAGARRRLPRKTTARSGNGHLHFLRDHPGMPGRRLRDLGPVGTLARPGAGARDCAAARRRRTLLGQGPTRRARPGGHEACKNHRRGGNPTRAPHRGRSEEFRRHGNTRARLHGEGRIPEGARRLCARARTAAGRDFPVRRIRRGDGAHLAGPALSAGGGRADREGTGEGSAEPARAVLPRPAPAPERPARGCGGDLGAPARFAGPDEFDGAAQPDRGSAQGRGNAGSAPGRDPAGRGEAGPDAGPGIRARRRAVRVRAPGRRRRPARRRQTRGTGQFPGVCRAWRCRQPDAHGQTLRAAESAADGAPFEVGRRQGRQRRPGSRRAGVHRVAPREGRTDAQPERAVTEHVSVGTRFAALPSPFAMKRGGELHGARMAYETWGTLNAARDNAVLILTGLSPSAHAAANEGDSEPGWWEAMLGPGKPIDTTRWYVVCVNSLGSCKGSTGPASADPATGAAYRLDFPELSIEDGANAAFEVVHSLGIDKLACVIGNSMGGMTALAFLKLHPGAARGHINVSGSARALPFSIAIRAAARGYPPRPGLEPR